MTKRILVVEDQEDNRTIVRDLLTNVGYEVIEVENGGRLVGVVDGGVCRESRRPRSGANGRPRLVAPIRDRGARDESSHRTPPARAEDLGLARHHRRCSRVSLDRRCR